MTIMQGLSKTQFWAQRAAALLKPSALTQATQAEPSARAQVETIATTPVEISETAKIVEMCQIAGHPEAIGGFIASHATASEVMAELLAGVGTAKPWGEVLETLGLKKKDGI